MIYLGIAFLLAYSFSLYVKWRKLICWRADLVTRKEALDLSLKVHDYRKKVSYNEMTKEAALKLLEGDKNLLHLSRQVVTKELLLKERSFDAELKKINELESKRAKSKKQTNINTKPVTSGPKYYE